MAIKLCSHASQSRAASGTCAAQLGQFLYILDSGCLPEKLSRILDGTVFRTDLNESGFLPASLVPISFITMCLKKFFVIMAWLVAVISWNHSKLTVRHSSSGFVIKSRRRVSSRVRSDTGLDKTSQAPAAIALSTSGAFP
jgi:hypothetical protein